MRLRLVKMIFLKSAVRNTFWGSIFLTTRLFSLSSSDALSSALTTKFEFISRSSSFWSKSLNGIGSEFTVNLNSDLTRWKDFMLGKHWILNFYATTAGFSNWTTVSGKNSFSRFFLKSKKYSTWLSETNFPLSFPGTSCLSPSKLSANLRSCYLSVSYLISRSSLFLTSSSASKAQSRLISENYRTSPTGMSRTMYCSHFP